VHPPGVLPEGVRQVLAALFGIWALVAAAILAGTMGLFLVVPFVPLPRGRREAWTMPGAALWAGVVLRWVLWTRVRIHGENPLPDGVGALVLCNHRSWLDPLLLIRYTHSNGLSKKSILYWPFIGIMGQWSGAVYFDRADRKDRQRARDEVLWLASRGHRIQVFPEGTRTREGRVGKRVYLNLAMDCHSRGIPVLCCAVWRTERVLPPGFFGAWWGQEVDLAYGKLLYPRDFPTSRTFAAACWKEVTDRLAELDQGDAGAPVAGRGVA
jgi:1-acyl-sn-glycerol-3-phosphate acyltransferase